MWAIVNSLFKNIKHVFNKEDKRQTSHGGTIQRLNNGKQSVFSSSNFPLPYPNKLFVNYNVPTIFPYTRIWGSHYQTLFRPSISKPFILNSISNPFILNSISKPFILNPYMYPHSHFYLPILLMSNKNKQKDKSVQSKLPLALLSPTTTIDIKTNTADR